MAITWIGAGRFSSAPAFSPLDIAWTHAFWASDPGWTPPADGGAVSSWNDAGTGGNDLAQATGANQPTYRASYANLNSKPAVEFDGTTDCLDMSGAATKTQPVTLVAVGYRTDTNAESTAFDSPDATKRIIMRPRSGGSANMLMFAGTTQRFGSALTAGFMMTGVFNGASSSCDRNGVAQTLGGTVGAGSYANVRLGADQGLAANSFFGGALAFMAVLDGTLTAGELSSLEAWVSSFYGITIS
jgi:hypothetical protein